MYKHDQLKILASQQRNKRINNQSKYAILFIQKKVYSSAKEMCEIFNSIAHKNNIEKKENLNLIMQAWTYALLSALPEYEEFLKREITNLKNVNQSNSIEDFERMISENVKNIPLVNLL